MQHNIHRMVDTFKTNLLMLYLLLSHTKVLYVRYCHSIELALCERKKKCRLTTVVVVLRLKMRSCLLCGSGLCISLKTMHYNLRLLYTLYIFFDYPCSKKKKHTHNISQITRITWRTPCRLLIYAARNAICQTKKGLQQKKWAKKRKACLWQYFCIHFYARAVSNNI